MTGVHRYRLRTTWTGNRGTGTSGYRHYTRDATLAVDGKPEIRASADKPFRGDPSRWNPEDLLLGALSECHLLSYLHACVESGVVVVDYSDEAVGEMRTRGSAGRFTSVTLRPRVTVADHAMVDAAMAAHQTASEWCFIANSVNFPVHHEPEILVAGRS